MKRLFVFLGLCAALTLGAGAPRAETLVMGLILGGLVEEFLSQSMIMFDNNWLEFFKSPIVDLFFFLTILGLFWPVITRAIGKVFARRKPNN